MVAVDQVEAALNGGAPPLPTPPSPSYADDDDRRVGERLAALVSLGDEINEMVSDVVADSLRKGALLRPGEFVEGRFRLLRKLVDGQVASTFEAWDIEEQRSVAVHVLHPHRNDDAELTQRFFSRAQAVEALEHPGLAKIVLPRGQREHFQYTITEHPSSRTLEAAAAEGLDFGPIAHILLEVADALHHAHEHGIVHGRLEPSRIVLAEESAHLVGLGLWGDAPNELYRAPETMDPTHTPSPLDDVYSFGMVALYAVYGKPLPFWVLRDPERLIQQIDVGDSSETFREALRGALDWDVDARTGSVQEFVAGLNTDASLVRSLAEAAAKSGRHEAAVGHYLALVERTDDPSLRLALARSLVALDRTEEATPHLEAAMAEGLGGDDLAALLVELGQWETLLQQHTRRSEAARALEALADKALAEENWLLYSQRQRERIAYLEGDDRAAAEVALGKVFLQRLDDQQNALLWLERAVEHGSEDADVPGILERIRSARGEWSAVVQLMQEQALDLPEAERAILLDRAAVLAIKANNDKDTAAVLYQEVLEARPEHTDALRFLARHRRKHELWERLDRDAADEYGYAKALLHQNNTDGALERLDAALAKNPAHIPSRRLAARLQRKLGNLQAAKDHNIALVDAFWGAGATRTLVGALLALGNIAEEEDAVREASDRYHQVLEVDPDNADAWWGITRVSMFASHDDEAPWLTATPARYGPHEALARVFSGLLQPGAVWTWLEREDPLPEDPIRVGATLVDELVAREWIGPDLFRRMRESFPHWAPRVEAVRQLWCGRTSDATLSIAESYRWSRRGLEDFDPTHHRDTLMLEPPAAGVGDEDAWEALFSGVRDDETEEVGTIDDVDMLMVSEREARKGALVAQRGTPQQVVLHLDSERTVVGSGDSDDLRIEGVAAGHATFLRCGVEWYVVDSSGAGLKVAGNEVDELRLSGDEPIELGPRTFEFVLYDVPADLERPPQQVTIAGAGLEALSRSPRAVLLHRTDEGADRLVPLSGPVFVVGGADDADLKVDTDADVLFRIHTRDGFTLEDPLGTTNEDGELVSERSLSHGDTLDIAGQQWELRILDEEEGEDDDDVVLANTQVPKKAVRRPVLVYDDGSLLGKILPIDAAEFTIGRGRKNDLQISNDGRVSRYHCKVLRKGDKLIVIDNNSSNGTQVNGADVSEYTLAEGDVMEVGATRFEFRYSEVDEEAEVDNEFDPSTFMSENRLSMVQPTLMSFDEPDESISSIFKKPVSVDDGLEKIKVANQALRVIMRAMDGQGGTGKGRAELQIVLEGTPRTYSGLFEEVKLGANGLPDMQVMYNLAQRPDPEQRRMLNMALKDLIDRSVSMACDTLPDEAVEALLEDIAHLSYREQLRI